jgi:hypothetical protein
MGVTAVFGRRAELFTRSTPIGRAHSVRRQAG